MTVAIHHPPPEGIVNLDSGSFIVLKDYSLLELSEVQIPRGGQLQVWWFFINVNNYNFVPTRITHLNILKIQARIKHIMHQYIIFLIYRFALV